ncbi:hypothetical protein QQP08_017322 [Theobroma cacao]|nr:hypothetical protein QQP08_017322 [Theobroma cacao]
MKEAMGRDTFIAFHTHSSSASTTLCLKGEDGASYFDFKRAQGRSERPPQYLGPPGPPASASAPPTQGKSSEV